MTRESMIALISNNVAEKALCWWDGRSKRNRRAAVEGGALEKSEELGTMRRFYTQLGTRLRAKSFAVQH